MDSSESSRRHPGPTFLDLPRELRDIVYSYIPDDTGVFTYDIHVRRRELLWKNDIVGSPKNGRFFEEQFTNHGVGFGTGRHRHAILRTCRTIYSEALPIVYGATPLGLWRPMADYGGRDKYFNFTTKVFESLPLHAGKHIRVLQIQGELWQRSMQILMAATVKYLPSLKVLDIALDPYYDNEKRRTWFDGGAAKQIWPSLAVLASRAQDLESINLTFAPPQDVVYIWQDEAKGVWLSHARYEHFIWSYIQWLALKNEVTIHGGLVLFSAKMAMERLVTVMEQRETLANIVNRKPEAEEYLKDLARLQLKNEQDWLQSITGRIPIEINEKERRITMISPREATKKWCKMTYTACPRGFADPEGLLSS